MGRSVSALVVWGYALLALAPLLLVVVNSFRRTSAIVAQPVGLPIDLYWGNYRKALTQGRFVDYLGNSVIITGTATLLCTLISTLAAYALTRWRLPGSSAVILIFLAGIMLPLRYSVIPLFYEFDSLSLIDSRLGLILFYAASGIPFSTFVLVPFCRQLPPELEEAAAIDGASLLRSFFNIMLPLLRPCLIVVAIFNFVPLWNEFFFPLILLRSPEKFPISVGLTTFFGKYSVDLGPLFAALVLASLPLVLIFLVAVRKIVDGLSAGISK